MQKTAYLVLQNGRVFKGKRFGADVDVLGEAVFTTAMTGYVETLTDPSYYGQIVVQTFPLIGNYGIIPEDFESNKPVLSGYVVREACDEPSNFRCGGTLEQYLIEQNIPGLCGIDTRALTRQIRTAGVMNAAIVSELPADLAPLLKKLAELPVPEAVSAVTGTRLTDEIIPNPVILWDMGYKGAIKRNLESRGLKVKVLPATATAEDILALEPQGLVISNGPGDPAMNVKQIAELAKLMQTKLPIMGICLGHQLMALAMGARSVKLKFGHRGANQPVKNPESGKLYITSQNHGYAIVPESLLATAKPLFYNANDGTLEGVIYLDRPAFSVQFHPEACAGPQSTGFLFDEFINLMKGGAVVCR